MNGFGRSALERFSKKSKKQSKEEEITINVAETVINVKEASQIPIKEESTPLDDITSTPLDKIDMSDNISMSEMVQKIEITEQKTVSRLNINVPSILKRKFQNTCRGNGQGFYHVYGAICRG